MKAKRDLIRPLAALAVLLAVVVFVAQWDTAKATYNPTMAASVSDAEAGANADVTTTVTIAAPDFNFDVMISFTPPQFGMGAEDIPIGAHVADLDSENTLGLLNNVCITSLSAAFDMLNASTNTADTVSFDDGFADLDGNTLPDAVDKYPDFLNTMYPGITPVARSYGQASVAGTPVSMNFVVFEPGTTLHGQAFDASLGYGSVSVLNDPTADLAPGSITDFCTPLLSATTRFGITKDNPDTAADESGFVGSTNPTTGGDYTFTTFSRSQGDADGDGIENDLDTCPFDVNEGDPRVAGDGDPDNDGLDNACDPEPDVANTDQDDDVYLNRGDNCPLVNNPDNADADGDRIGDACDPHPNTVDGEGIDVTLTATVTVYGAGSIGIYRPSDGMWFLRNDNSGGVADLTFSYGAGISGAIPVVGDWNNDDTDTIGLYQPSTGLWFLRNTNTSGVADLTFSYGAGVSGGVPVVGDWDGDGDDTIGIYRASDGMWFLRNENTSGVADLTFSYGAGISSGVPVVGDWDGDGDDTIGIYRASDGMWFLRSTNSSGVADLTFSYGAGISDAVAAVGDWDGL